MKWENIKNKLPLKKRWQRYTIGIFLVFHIVMVNLRTIYKEMSYIDLIIYSCYGLFLIIFTWIYFKHPQKFRD